MAACHPSLPFVRGRSIEVSRLTSHPLLLLDSGFGFRRAFDAACRLAGLSPKLRMESRSPHTLLALAEAGHGVAIIPSALRTDRYDLRVVGLTYSGKLLREPLSILWDKRRPLPRYATAFCAMWAEYVREIFPITRPSDAKTSGSSKLAVIRRTGRHLGSRKKN
jgi:LysR family nitrogen assimilation transcriptional regulator